MAERRMFAKTIIDSDSFLDMPLSTQALYFHLSMRGDDEGFINNPKKLARMLGSNDDELKVLMAKKFIILFDSGVIVIKHWKMHNYIRGDRIKDTNYLEERDMLLTNENGSYTMIDDEVSQMSVTCPSNVSIGKVRLGKVSIVKDRINKDAALISDFKEETNAGEVAINLVTWFIQHRKNIKKPIKTIAPMKLLITEMRKCINEGYKIEAMQELMEAKEWQSIKLEWVVKELPKKQEAINTGRTIGGYQG